MKKATLSASIVLLYLLFTTPAASANTINYDTGVFKTGSFTGSLATGSPLSITINGSLTSTTLSIVSLTQFTANCPILSSCFSFTSGSITVAHNNVVVFSDSLSGGIVISSSSLGFVALNAILVGKNDQPAGIVTEIFTTNGPSLLSSGSGTVSFNSTAIVPEESTLFLFGSGVSIIGIFTKYHGKFIH